MNSSSSPTPDSLCVICDLVEAENAVKPRFIEGKEIPDCQQGPDIDAYTKQMESRGWMVSDSQTGQVFIFKRCEGDAGPPPI